MYVLLIITNELMNIFLTTLMSVIGYDNNRSW